MTPSISGSPAPEPPVAPTTQGGRCRRQRQLPPSAKETAQRPHREPGWKRIFLLSLVTLLAGGGVLSLGVTIYGHYQKCGYQFSNPPSCGQSDTAFQAGFGALMMVGGGVVVLIAIGLFILALISALSKSS